MEGGAVTEYAVRNVVKAFGGVRALRGVSMSFTPGTVHCLAGENGSGKSTLIKIMTGVEQPDSGSLTIADREVASLQPPEAIAAGIQVIFQDFSLLPNLSVGENIALGTELARGRRLVSQRRSVAIATESLARIGVSLDPYAKVADIPVAAKQLVAIARAITQDVRLLFMDEPTTALTRREIQRLFDVVRQLTDQGVATVFVSHKVDEMEEIADLITILRNGEVVAEGTMADFPPARVSEAMTGVAVADHRDVTPVPPEAPVVLDVRGISRTGAFENVSFQIRRGEILGLTGLLGSGRTQVAEALFGLLPPQSGSVAIDGAAVSLRSPMRAARAGIGYVPEDRLTEGLFLTQSIGRNIVAASLRRLTSPLGVLSTSAVAAAVTSAVTNFAIRTPDPLNPANSLSGGNQQRVVLAKWLAQTPRVFVLNGPTVGVDIGSKAEILRIIRAGAESGMAILVISDDIPELIQVAHRVLVIRHGQIATEIADADLTTERLYAELAA